MTNTKHVAVGLALVAVALTVGAVAAAAQGMGAAPAAPKVHIVAPAKGAVTGPTVQVTLEATGIEIAPAADKKPGTAHHHLFLDVNVTAADSAIPIGVPGIVHLGKGQSTYTFEGVAPGLHRLIDVLADPSHVPLKPMVADTVTFTVKS